jgi:ketosteroid isomerase-like protein/uncharacterized membrane protein
MIEIIPNWHPIWVHFAIALLSTGAAIYLVLGWKPGRVAGAPSTALMVARWMLWLGAFAAVTALLTGYWASGTVAHDDLAHANMMVHRNWAFAATLFFTAVALLEYLRRNDVRASVFSALLLLVGSSTLLMTGLEGAENVYEHGLGVQRLPVVSAHEHAHEEVAEAPVPAAGVSDDGHSHSHSDSQSVVSQHSSVSDTDHPASQAAAKLSQAIAAGDVEQLRKLLAPDVLIFESGNVESSLAEYESHHMQSDMAFMKAMNIEVESRHVFDSGDTAIVVTLSRIHGMYKEKELDLSSTETLVMKNIVGQWKIVHIHWSSG